MKSLLFIFIILAVGSCKSVGFDPGPKSQIQVNVNLPYLNNSSNECYYLDEFMPSPDSLVTGESGSLNLRYYTYLRANYKEYEGDTIYLSFYSLNQKCWSLYEEAFQKAPMN